jgi:hypothetical protein
MANSPLELYEKAYQLQYEKNDLATAIEIYSRLVKEFPDSNECGYAAIQLEKVQAAGILDEIARTQKQTSPIPLIALIIGIIALVACAVLAALLMAKSAREARISSDITQAIAFLYAGKNEEALTLISELQKQFPAHSDAQSLISEIQSKKADSPQASMPPIPPVSAQPDTIIEETRVETMEMSKQEVVLPPSPKPKELPVLSRQQKALSHKLMTKPARKPAAEQAAPSTPAAKANPDDTISFFP